MLRQNDKKEVDCINISINVILEVQNAVYLHVDH